MSAPTYKQDEIQNENPFDKCSSSKIDPELMGCGQVFFCFISEDLVFFCGLCENNTCKYTIFDEFANHIKKNHIMLSNDDADDDPNDEPYMYAEEMQENLFVIDKKESPEEQTLSEFEIDYLNYSDEEIENNIDKESLNEAMELFPEDENHVQAELQPKQYLLRWPDCQVLQFINLYRQEECLWNIESKFYHQSKVKEDAYQQIVHKFNKLHPNALEEKSSVKNVIKELLNFFNDFGEEQQQTTEVSSYHEIYKSLQFLKNVSNSRPVQYPETTNDCDNYFQKDFAKSKRQHNNAPKDLNNLSMDTLPTNCTICPICRINFENSKELKIHLSDLTTNLQKKVCDICGAKFDDPSKFITHLRHHKNEKKFVCTVCLERFATSTELESHAVVHNNEKPFICETCGLQFKFLNQLENHKLRHGDPLFECNDCNMKFLLKPQLVYHQRKHGPKEMMVSCDVCKNMYRNKDSLSRHERKIHNMRKRGSKNKF